MGIPRWSMVAASLELQHKTTADEAQRMSLTIDSVFRAHASFVARVLRRLDVPTADLDDALQEVFLIVSSKLHTYEERGAMRSWLFSIARQVASHARRALGRRALREERAGRCPAPELASPEQSLRERQAAELLRAFLSTLPEEQAMTFYLAEVEGLSAPEISACDGTNLNTVYARMRLSRKRFDAFVRALDSKEHSHG